MIRLDSLRMDMTDRWELNDVLTRTGGLHDGLHGGTAGVTAGGGRVNKATDRFGITFGMRRW